MPEAIVLVTGGNRGIGLECCRQLAARGARVIMGARDPAKGESARRSLGELAARVRVEQLATDDPASITACAARLANDPGRVDALINNAAVYDKADAPASQLPLAVLQRTVATNVHG